MGEKPDLLEPFLPLPELTTTLYLAFGRASDDAVVKAYTEACHAMIASGDVKRLMHPATTN